MGPVELSSTIRAGILTLPRSYTTSVPELERQGRTTSAKGVNYVSHGGFALELALTHFRIELAIIFAIASFHPDLQWLPLAK